jgi:hypothetical protein
MMVERARWRQSGQQVVSETSDPRRAEMAVVCYSYVVLRLAERSIPDFFGLQVGIRLPEAILSYGIAGDCCAVQQIINTWYIYEYCERHSEIRPTSYDV